MSRAAIVERARKLVEPRHKQTAQRHDCRQAHEVAIHRGYYRLRATVLRCAHANQCGQMTDPHSGSESLAADVAEGQHHSVLRFFNSKKVAGQVTHSEDLARDLKWSVVNQGRRTQTP